MSENKLMKFKIGDRVETLISNSYRDIGSIGTIIDFQSLYIVEFDTADRDGDYTFGCYDDGIQLVQKRQPTKDEILKGVLSDIIKSYYPHLTDIEITIKSDIEIKL